uniref:Si:dkey-63d15.12 n=1 Tax=Cyprinus carpio TaxID=7962 RepID=A0A8C2ERI6_CYPCA
KCSQMLVILTYVSLPNLGILSVWQIPEITAKEGTNVIITCHIKADSHVGRIMVKWCQDNQTVPNSTTPYQRSPVNGSVRINATLHLLSVHLNQSSIYYCTAQVDLPTLGPVEIGNGTHVYVGELYFLLALFSFHFFKDSQCTLHISVLKMSNEQSKMMNIYTSLSKQL